LLDAQPELLNEPPHCVDVRGQDANVGARSIDDRQIGSLIEKELGSFPSQRGEMSIASLEGKSECCVHCQ